MTVVTMKKSKPSKKQSKIKLSDADLPAADQQIAKTRRIENEEKDALHKTICIRVGKLRDMVKETGQQIIDMNNEARAIGLLITEEWDKLPGKQMTTDFWQKQQDLYRDAKGRPIELEWLKWMVKVSRELPEPITDLRQALGNRQQLFLLGEFHLEGEAPYLANGNGAEDDRNPFNLIRVQAEKYARNLAAFRQSLVADKRFGPISRWRADQKALVRAKVEPLFKEVSEFMRELETVEV